MFQSNKMYAQMGAEDAEECQDRELGMIPHTQQSTETTHGMMLDRCEGKQFLSVLACFIFVVLAVLVFAAVLAAWGLGAEKDKDHADDLPPGAKRTSFCTPPIIVHADEHLEWDSDPISRESTGFPSDKPIFIQTIDLHIRDRRGRLIPLQQIYNHHTFLMSASPEGTDVQTLAAFGAERVRIDYGHSEGLLLRPEEIIFANGEWLDVWGKLATINQTVRACFDVIYISADDQAAAAYLDDPLLFSLFGTSHNGGDFEYAIPPNSEDGVMCMSSEAEWKYDSIEIFFILGHVHIGAVNQSLVDKSDNRTLVVAHPHYDYAGFIDDIRTDIKTSPLVMSKGSTYKTVACYSNRDHGYSRVMSLWAVYYRNLDHPGSIIFFDDTPEDTRRRFL